MNLFRTITRPERRLRNFQEPDSDPVLIKAMQSTTRGTNTLLYDVDTVSVTWQYCPQRVRISTLASISLPKYDSRGEMAGLLVLGTLLRHCTIHITQYDNIRRSTSYGNSSSPDMAPRTRSSTVRAARSATTTCAPAATTSNTQPTDASAMRHATIAD